MLDETLEILSKNFLFADLTPEELLELKGYLRPESFEAGEHIVREGEEGDSLYLVTKGGVNVTKEPDNHFLSYIGSGGYFGDMALFMPHSVRTASCIAAMKTECQSIDKASLEEFCTTYPVPGNKIYREIIRAISERLAITSADLAMLMKQEMMGQSKVSEIVASKK